MIVGDVDVDVDVDINVDVDEGQGMRGGDGLCNDVICDDSDNNYMEFGYGLLNTLGVVENGLLTGFY